MVALSVAYSASSRTPQLFKFLSSDNCLYSFDRFSINLAGLLVLGRGVDCCASWVSFFDRAAVMAVAASVRAWETGDSLFFLLAAFLVTGLLNLLLLVGACYTFLQLLIQSKYNIAFGYNWLLTFQQCLKFAAYLHHVSCSFTFSIGAYHWNHHHHHCVTSSMCNWSITPQNCVFLWLP